MENPSEYQNFAGNQKLLSEYSRVPRRAFVESVKKTDKKRKQDLLLMLQKESKG
jgi:hypothetical protein